MHDESGRLVDDDHDVVDVDDRRTRPTDRRRAAERSGAAVGSTVDVLTLGQAHLARLAPPTPSTRGAAGGDQRGRIGAADVGDQRDDPVEAFPVECGWNDFIDHDVRRLSVVVLHGCRRRASSPRSPRVRLTRMLFRINAAAPTFTAMSATLKIGNHWKSMKSTTAPLEPGVTAEHAVDQVPGRATDQASHTERAELRPAGCATTPGARR